MSYKAPTCTNPFTSFHTSPKSDKLLQRFFEVIRLLPLYRNTTLEDTWTRQAKEHGGIPFLINVDGCQQPLEIPPDVMKLWTDNPQIYACNVTVHRYLLKQAESKEPAFVSPAVLRCDLFHLSSPSLLWTLPIHFEDSFEIQTVGQCYLSAKTRSVLWTFEEEQVLKAHDEYVKLKPKDKNTHFWVHRNKDVSPKLQTPSYETLMTYCKHYHIYFNRYLQAEWELLKTAGSFEAAGGFAMGQTLIKACRNINCIGGLAYQKHIALLLNKWIKTIVLKEEERTKGGWKTRTPMTPLQSKED